ncbi:MAG: hypothetical protein PF442_04565 [Desulfobulbaceae bacterium]|jgi:ADP-heptose:LPS heptosyltransferase|nr:hypothetical protein [Desulfobulbaceae bacterium]
MAQEAKKKAPNLAAIKLLGAMCLDTNKILAAQADRSLYQKIIIPLCDDFSTQGFHVVNLILAALIQQSATLIADESRQILDNEGLQSAVHLIARLERIHSNAALSARHKNQVRKITLLSRVTVGADLAITSIIIQRLHNFFPDIPITLIGPDHLSELFNQPFLCHRLFDFNRDKPNYSRMGQWHKLKKMIDAEHSSLNNDEFLFIDPDTRLSQLGLLPLAPEESTRILPSRLDQATECSLSAITNSWLDVVLGETAFTYPAYDSPTGPPLKANRTFTIAINFGVGNDLEKRISLQFEQELTLALIRLGRTRVILDSGKGANEVKQAKAIESYVHEQETRHDMQDSFIRIQGSIATLASHIKNADLFIGYDSCSGHIAAASDTPTIICFKGAPNPRFQVRWQPQNRSGLTSCLEVGQKQFNDEERSLLIRRIIDIASSQFQQFQ